MTEQALHLLMITALGASCACLYDLFRAAHRLMKRHTAAVNVSDVLYWLIVTVGVIYALWLINDIEVLLYQIAGLIIGVILYFLLFSAYIYRFFSVITEKTAKIMLYILKILLTPVRFLYKIITAFIFFTAKKFTNLFKRMLFRNAPEGKGGSTDDGIENKS